MTIDNRRRGEGLERDTQRGALGFPDWAELRLPQDKGGVGFLGRISLRQEESVCPGKRMGRAVVEVEDLHAACLGGARTGDVWDHVWRIQREQRPAAGSRGSWVGCPRFGGAISLPCFGSSSSGPIGVQNCWLSDMQGGSRGRPGCVCW